MPVVTFHHEHRSIDVESGTNLRQLMLRVGVPPYKGLSRLTNCRGHNFCGTCAVEVVDGKGASPRTDDEEITLGGNLLIARIVEKNIRLACQTKVVGDMVVRTHLIRQVDKQKTKDRAALAGIIGIFSLLFLAVVVFLVLDMVKQF